MLLRLALPRVCCLLFIRCQRARLLRHEPRTAEYAGWFIMPMLSHVINRRHVIMATITYCSRFAALLRDTSHGLPSDGERVTGAMTSRWSYAWSYCCCQSLHWLDYDYGYAWLLRHDIIITQITLFIDYTRIRCHYCHYCHIIIVTLKITATRIRHIITFVGLRHTLIIIERHIEPLMALRHIIIIVIITRCHCWSLLPARALIPLKKWQ